MVRPAAEMETGGLLTEWMNTTPVSSEPCRWSEGAPMQTIRLFCHTVNVETDIRIERQKHRRSDGGIYRDNGSPMSLNVPSKMADER